MHTSLVLIFSFFVLVESKGSPVVDKIISIKDKDKGLTNEPNINLHIEEISRKHVPLKHKSFDVKMICKGNPPKMVKFFTIDDEIQLASDFRVESIKKDNHIEYKVHVTGPFKKESLFKVFLDDGQVWNVILK